MSQAYKVRQIYIKDVSFQAPMGVKIFTSAWAPETKVEIKVDAHTISGISYEVVLTVTVISRNNNETAFMIEVQQAGIFDIANLSADDLDRTLHTACPSALYPYAREVVDSLIVKGRLPTLLLDPIDFEASYSAKRH